MGAGYSHQTKGTPLALAAEIRKLQTDLAALRRGMANLGIQIDTVDNELIVGAGRSLIVNGNETVSGTLDVTGNMIVGGTLSLPNGIINNAALENPIYPVALHATGTNFAWNTTMTAHATASTAVPSGFTSAIVYAVSSVSGINSTTSPDTIYAGINVGGLASGTATGSDAISSTSWNALASSYAPQAELLTGLSGTLSVTASGKTAFYTWASSPSNVANIDAIALFLR